jgi:hypothetical protein
MPIAYVIRLILYLDSRQAFLAKVEVVLGATNQMQYLFCVSQ